MMWTPQTIGAVGLVALVAGFGAGWATNGWRLNADHAAAVNADLVAARDQLKTMTADRDAKARDLAALADANDKALKGAQNETNDLRDRLRAGAVGLRIAAKCPKPADSASAATGTGVDTGTGAGLDPTAERAYFALRDAINVTQGKLTGCQGELRVRVR